MGFSVEQVAEIGQSSASWPESEVHRQALHKKIDEYGQRSPNPNTQSWYCWQMLIRARDHSTVVISEERGRLGVDDCVQDHQFFLGATVALGYLQEGHAGLRWLPGLDQHSWAGSSEPSAAEVGATNRVQDKVRGVKRFFDFLSGGS